MPSAECLEKETNTLALSSKLFKQPSLGTKVERKLVKNGVHPLHLKWKEKAKKTVGVPVLPAPPTKHWAFVGIGAGGGRERRRLGGKWGNLNKNNIPLWPPFPSLLFSLLAVHHLLLYLRFPLHRFSFPNIGGVFLPIFFPIRFHPVNLLNLNFLA